jgi:hypothetical protein
MKPRLLSIVLLGMSLMAATQPSHGQANGNPTAEAPTRPIRYLIAYTQAVEDSLGGPVNCTAALFDAAQEFRTVLQNSQVHRDVQLVRTVKLPMVESSDFYDDVFRFAGNATVQSLRIRYQADLAVIVMNNNSWCGTPLFQDQVAELNTAYCGVDWRCMVEAYGLAHQVAHLFGAGHNPTNDMDIPDDAYTTYGHAYDWAYLDTGIGFKTVMGYGDLVGCCWEFEGSGPFIPHFSNPDVWYSGVPTGIDSLCDNARLIRTFADSVAFYALPSTNSSNDTVAFADMALLQGIDHVHPQWPYMVKDSASVWFRAATRVVMEPGFRVEEGAYFETVLDSAMLNMR